MFIEVTRISGRETMPTRVFVNTDAIAMIGPSGVDRTEISFREEIMVSGIAPVTPLRSIVVRERVEEVYDQMRKASAK
jgi:uncharacterized protein YlzI (FlbEa/FlbD family)